MAIEFNPGAAIPSANNITQTLVDAVNTTNSIFNVTIDPNSVTVRAPPTTTAPPTTVTTTASTTTAAPTTTVTTTASTTTAAPTTTVTTTASTTTAAPTTTVTTTASTTTAAPTTTVTTTASTTTAAPTTALPVTFRSVQDTFTNDLLDPSSTAFINRASMIKRQLEPPLSMAFSSFRALNVVSFSNGSIITNALLSFVNTSVPDNTQIANTLIQAASDITGFDIEISSISVNGISSSGVSHKISLVTASCLVLLSWLLSSQQ
ncbi:uncharacterized protein LOC141760718 [Sebastes fasciatus]|uniref:uncharacterized protein LOC141760718 n=1 Tax=Sebastes fasciatus TaxID=394691 RepID=UPI003D9F8C74